MQEMITIEFQGEELINNFKKLNWSEFEFLGSFSA